MKRHWIWSFVYIFWPPILRILEAIGIHKGRQDYLIGRLRRKYPKENLREFLLGGGFEDAILAWKDTDEILNMRKIDKNIFQYHIRLFKDGEIRGHYEYASEGKPWSHIRDHHFEPRREYFATLLKGYL